MDGGKCKRRTKENMWGKGVLKRDVFRKGVVK